jgi:hypothetical protein
MIRPLLSPPTKRSVTDCVAIEAYSKSVHSEGLIGMVDSLFQVSCTTGARSCWQCNPIGLTLSGMAALSLIVFWVAYLAWLATSSEESRRAHIVVAWAVLFAGALASCVPLLL